MIKFFVKIFLFPAMVLFFLYSYLCFLVSPDLNKFNFKITK